MKASECVPAAAENAHGKCNKPTCDDVGEEWGRWWMRVWDGTSGRVQVVQ